MKKMVGLLGSFALCFALTGTARTAQAQQDPAAPQDAPQVAPPQAAPPAPQYTPPPAAQDTAPPMQQRVYSYPTGQWVYMDGDGWVWVPAGASTEVVEGAPYAYLYTPAYGWTWYISPWGAGAYHYGGWVTHPWRPVGWRGGWVAHPRIVAHFGGRPGVRFGGPRAVVRVGGGGRAAVVHGGGGGGYHGGTFHGGGGFHGGGHGGHR